MAVDMIARMMALDAAQQGGGTTVDQTYTPTSENAQSGTAVAEALGSIPSVTVDQTFNGTSANAQSGVAVQQAISSDKYTLDSYYTSRIVTSSVPYPNQSGYYATTYFCSLSVYKPQSLPRGYYIVYTLSGIMSAYVDTSKVYINGFQTEPTSQQYTQGSNEPGSVGPMNLIKID